MRAAQAGGRAFGGAGDAATSGAPPLRASKPDRRGDSLRKRFTRGRRDAHAAVAREQLLHLAQTTADFALVEGCYRTGHVWCALVGATVVLLQHSITWAFSYVYVQTMAGGSARRPRFVDSILAFGPFGVFGFDQLLVLDALRLVCLDEVDFFDLTDLVPTYRASRAVFAAFFQAAPVLVLHAALARARARAASPPALVFATPAMSTWDGAVVAASLTLAARSLVLAVARLRGGALLARIPLVAYMSTVLDIGAGLPLHALYTHTMSAYTLGWDPEPDELAQLCAVLSHNRSLVALDMSDRGLGDEHAMQLARMVRGNRLLRLLWLGRTTYRARSGLVRPVGG